MNIQEIACLLAITLLIGIELFPVWRYYKKCYQENVHTNIWVDICFSFSWINTSSTTGRYEHKCTFNTVNLPKYFSKWLHHLTFPLATQEIPIASHTYSPVLGIVSFFLFILVILSGCVMFFSCSFNLHFPMSNSAEHLFMYLLAINRSHSVKCIIIFCPYLSGLSLHFFR